MSIFRKRRNYGHALTYIVCLLCAFAPQCLQAQTEFFRITFADKGPGAFVPGIPLYDNTLATYHPKSIERRRRIGFAPLLNHQDRPIHQPYLDSLRALQITFTAASNWNNCVITDIDSATAVSLRKLSFVESVKRTAQVSYVTVIEPENCGPVDPGESKIGLDLLNVLPLIGSGVGGHGTIIGMIDNGFEYRGMSSLAHADVLGEIDIVYDDSNVASAPPEPWDQSLHGSSVFSVVGGWLPGVMVGTSPFASFLLCKTEDMRFEYRVEEDNFVSGVEWLERNGADILSASVGYFGWDSTQDSMRYEWLDGHTTYCSRAYNLAAERGVMVVMAAGNSGPLPRTLITPGDADSAITVGGCRDDRTWWPSSSLGPTADGRTKPDVAALGIGVPNQSPTNNILHSSGTSLATPQISGCLALLHQLFPEQPPWMIRLGLYASATTAASVSNQLGFGIPDVVHSARLLGTVDGPGVSPPTIVIGLTEQLVLCAIYSLFEPSAILTFAEAGVPAISASEVDSLWVQFPIQPSYFQNDTLHGRITVANGSGTNAYPSDSTWFVIVKNQIDIPCGVRIPKNVVSVEADEYIRNRDAATLYNKPTVAPNPITEDQRSITVFGISRTANTIRLIETSTGIELPITWQRNSDGAAHIDLPLLHAGHFTLAIGSANNFTSHQLIVL